MKIFFLILSGIIVVFGILACAYMLIYDQFALFGYWDIAIVLAISLLVATIPFGIAVTLAKLQKSEQFQHETNKHLGRKVNVLEAVTKNLYEEIGEQPKMQRLLYDGADSTKVDSVVPISEHFETTQNPIEPLPVNDRVTASRIARIVLFVSGIICLGLSVYYLFLLIFHGRWDDLNVRIPQLIQFFGGILFMVLSKVLRNQERLICLANERKGHEH